MYHKTEDLHILQQNKSINLKVKMFNTKKLKQSQNTTITTIINRLKNVEIKTV
jgi:hypothetical protein